MFEDAIFTVVHRVPMCAVSIGFTVNRSFIVGVIYNPILEELFEATQTTSSRLNGKEIHVSKVDRLNSAAVSTEAGSDREPGKSEFIISNLTTVLRKEAQCVRMFGSCSLNMAYLACGRTDVLYERGPSSWDMAAGVLIIRRAGGIVCGGSLGRTADFDLTGRYLLAYTPTMREALRISFGTPS